MTSNFKSIERLLRPKTIAMVGGSEVVRAIMQCDRVGYDGTIWPVHPYREQIGGLDCYASLHDLPAAPDAAFIAIPGESTVEAVEYLASIGTGGVVCYASGFAEVGESGVRLQRRLERAIGSMALIGPNCYGVCNYLDGVAMWPDEQGGRRCDRGVAIFSQSGNISINLTMQRRAVPLAYVVSTGNMAGIKTHDFIRFMLDDERVSAIGLYLEGIPDAYALSEAAIAALQCRKPIVVLESGRSELGSKVTLSHSSSLTGQGQVNSAFYNRYGMQQVHTLPEFLETLKFLSIQGPLKENSIATISCSGGEAAIMADRAESLGLEFAPLTDAQTRKLNGILGDRVVVSNPLDYHTYIWGVPDQQKRCFQAVFEGDQAITVNALDYPSEGLCNIGEWDDAVQAIIDARNGARAQVAVMASLHENLPESVQFWLSDHGIAPMLGLDECFKAILSSIAFGERCQGWENISPLVSAKRGEGDIETLTEFEAKRELSAYGLPVVEGREVGGADEAIKVCEALGFPVVVKASTKNIVHKTEAGAVHVNLRSADAVREAITSMADLSSKFLVEKMAPAPHIELLVGVRYDDRFGLIMVLGAGGTLVDLIADIAIVMFPLDDAQIERALDQLKIGKLLKRYRGASGDLHGVKRAIHAIASYAAENSDRLVELELNPLHVYEEEDGVLAVDVVIRKISGS